MCCLAFQKIKLKRPDPQGGLDSLIGTFGSWRRSHARLIQVAGTQGAQPPDTLFHLRHHVGIEHQRIETYGADCG
jgi:hypothetical protein